MCLNGYFYYFLNFIYIAWQYIASSKIYLIAPKLITYDIVINISVRYMFVLFSIHIKSSSMLSICKKHYGDSIVTENKHSSNLYDKTCEEYQH